MSDTLALFLALTSLSLVTTLLLTPLVKSLSLKFGWVDLPGTRKVHSSPIPRLGGVAIYLGFLLAILFSFPLERPVLGVVFGSFIALVTGILDDLFNIKPWIKLLGQFLAAGVTVYYGIEISVVSNPFGGILHLGTWGIPLTILWLLATMNTINLIDGLDGLAAGIAAISALTISVVALHSGQVLAAGLTLALLGACLGFLKFNFAPAQIFMGDSGSMVLGYILGVSSMVGVFKSTVTLSVVIPVLVLGIPISDTFLAIVRRAKNKQGIFKADQGHIHHKLLKHGFTPKQAVLVCYAGSIILGLLALVMSVTSGIIAYVIFFGVILAVSLSTTFFKKRYQRFLSFFRFFS